MTLRAWWSGLAAGLMVLATPGLGWTQDEEQDRSDRDRPQASREDREEDERQDDRLFDKELASRGPAKFFYHYVPAQVSAKLETATVLPRRRTRNDAP